jgi:hypothetical protein
LELYATYGFGIEGTTVVFAYLLFWEIVGRMFDEARKKTPTPLRFLVTIIEDLFGISLG